MNIHESAEDYLEMILRLQESQKFVRAVDISVGLSVTKPSVSVAMRNLRENGYITIDSDNHIWLTDTGLSIAQKIYERHKLLTDLFTQIGVNPRTAEGIGLDIWGRIVGIGRRLWLENDEFFGFSYQDLLPFDQAPFWNKSASEGQFPLSDDAYRLLIFYKAAANIGRGDMASVNSLLQLLFAEKHGPDSCFVLEIAPMSIKAVFTFDLTSYEVALLKQYGLLNRPAGVEFSWFQVNTGAVFGFSGSGLQPFDQGVFTPYTEQTPSN